MYLQEISLFLIARAGCRLRPSAPDDIGQKGNHLLSGL